MPEAAPQSAPPRALTVDECAAALNLSAKQVRYAVQQGARPPSSVA